jgi:hypothetical protein
MKTLKYIAAVTCTLLALNASAQWTSKDFKKLKNLKGNWEATTAKGLAQEKWKRINDSTFEGEVYTIERGVSIMNEKAKITLTSKGEIIFNSDIHYLNKGLPVVFKLEKIDHDKFIFTNRDKAFVQQIIYQMVGSDNLKRTTNRTLNGLEDKGPQAVDFSFKRI